MMHVIVLHVQRTLQFPNHWYKYYIVWSWYAPRKCTEIVMKYPHYWAWDFYVQNPLFPWNPTREVQHRLCFRGNMIVLRVRVNVYSEYYEYQIHLLTNNLWRLQEYLREHVGLLFYGYSLPALV
jgi:hypothetical protein